MIQAWMIIQFRNRMHRNGVNLAEKKSSFSKFIMEKIPVCNLALLDFHQNISNFLGCNVKTRFFFIQQLILCYLDYQKNSVKMQNHGTKNLSNRKLKIHWIVYQIIFHRKKNRQINELTLSHSEMIKTLSKTRMISQQKIAL